MDSNLNLDVLPPEVVVQYLLRLSLKDLVNYCLTSKTANAYCKDNAFWKDKYRYDFGLPLPKNPTKKWIDLYKSRKHPIENYPISAGREHYAVIDDRGILYMAGNNDWGQLGDGTENDSKIPITIKFFKQKVISVSCGNHFTIAITKNGKTYGWGYNLFIKGSNKMFLIPTLIPKLANYKAVKVSCGGSDWGVILDDGSIYVSLHLITGTGDIEIEDRITLEDKIIDISVFSSRFAVVTKKGKIYFAGEEVVSTRGFLYHELVGIDVDGDIPGPIKPEYISFQYQQGITPKIKQVSLAGTHITALTEDGNVIVWGDYDNGLLGLHHNDPRNRRNVEVSPELITLPKISYISSFSNGSAVITKDGRLYVLGRNKIISILSNYQEGDKRFGYEWGIRSAVVPIEIDIGSNVNYVSFGANFSIVTTEDGIVNYMGDPDYGPP